MIVVVLPGLLGPWVEEMSELRHLAERGRIRRVSELPPVATPEASWLGLPPSEANLADGPLMVAALGAEPPERSLQFHLSLLGLLDGQIVAPAPPTAAEAAKILPLLPKLNSKRLTGLAGEGVDHALVLEGFWDLGTTTRDAAIGKPITEVRPEGELESEMRRYVDDSVNMLSELELNDRRIDAGEAPLNLFWPWGQGMPRRMPNLALRRGTPATVESDSWRMQGLARLVGYRHGSRAQFGQGVDVGWAGLAERARSRAATVIASEVFRGFEEERAVWSALEVDRRLLAAFQDEEILLVADGLILEVSDRAVSTGLPFRPDVVDDGRVESVDLHEAIDVFLS